MDTTTTAPALVTALPGATAAAVVWRTRGQLHVTVIAKATFAFAPDAEMPRADPQPFFHGEVYHGGHAPRTVRFASDQVPYLGHADVVFTGYAHAPAGGAVRSMPVRLTLFDGDRVLLDKALLVQDRAPFQRMPIVYERSTSGADRQENPFGVDPGAGPDAPNVVDPRDPARPAGFGPIARAWPARRRLLGGTPRAALEGPIQELPDTFDWSYFQSAPPDQRTGYLRGGEWIVLQGLHPTVADLRMRLPAARGLARVHGLSASGVAEGQLLELQADTLRIDGEEQRCTLVFRRSFPVAGEAALAGARIVAGVELPGAPLAWPARVDEIRAAARVAGAAAPAPDAAQTRSAAETVVFADDAPGATPQPAVPFRPGPAPEAFPRHSGAPLPRQATGTLALGPGEVVRTLAAPFEVPRSPASQTLAAWAEDEPAPSPPTLPFQPPPPGATLPLSMSALAPIAPRERVSSGTFALSPDDEAHAVRESALPFSPASTAPGSASEARHRPASPPAAQGASAAWEDTSLDDEDTHVALPDADDATHVVLPDAGDAGAPLAAAPPPPPPDPLPPPPPSPEPARVISTPTWPEPPPAPAAPPPPRQPKPESPALPAPAPSLTRSLYERFNRK